MAGKKIQIMLAEETLQKLEQLCKEKGIKKSAAIAVAIDYYLKQDSIAAVRDIRKQSFKNMS